MFIFYLVFLVMVAQFSDWATGWMTGIQFLAGIRILSL